MRVDDACQAFLAQHQASLARMDLLVGMLAHARRAFGAVEVEQLEPQVIATWRASLPPATRWQATQALAQVTAWAARWQLVATDPMSRVANPRPARTEFTPLDDWEQVAAIAAQLPHHLALLPWIGAGCGLRPGELLGLCWDCVDLDRGELTVRRSVWRGELRSSLKTRRSRRVVPLRRAVAEQLAQAARPRSGLVFATARGTPLDLHNLRARAWRPALERAGIEPARRLYDLRHTYATWSLRAGVSIFQLARRMGTSVDMIDTTYGHLAADAGDHERRLLDAWDRA
ncbi:MAG: site-specific integrase [Thermoleophilia bacterium]|nr:site-specific integrase [Thermoleophilia bacterium]